MKYNYKQILEAINRGINLALDDFEDNNLQTLSHGKIKSKNYTKEYLYLKNNFVDLGLPSGTLWCKYNLGCDFNKLNNIPKLTYPKEWYGNYYAWGEIEPNKAEKYTLYNYKHAKQVLQYGKIMHNMTKYCMDDNLTQLLPEDDVVYQNMQIDNLKFYIPTANQFLELLLYTRQFLEFEYKNINNLRGFLLKSKINGNELFIPATGYIGKDGLTCKDGMPFDGYLWSSTLAINKWDKASSLGFASDINICTDFRNLGFPVRAVIEL